MLKLIKGGCLCGKVRYELTGKPVFSGNCHCRDCQKVSGSAYVAAMFVLQESASIQGDIRYFESKADSGCSISRGFCPHCGSQILAKLELLPNVLGFRAGTFDNPDNYEPKMDIYTSSAAHWDVMNPNLPKFEKSPN